MKNRLFSKYLSLLLVVLMVFSLLPASNTLAVENSMITVTESLQEKDSVTDNTVNVNVIVALDTYDGWQILYPDSTDTLLTVSNESTTPSAIDVVKAVDNDFDGSLTNNRPAKFLGYSRNANGYGNWSARKLSGGSYSNITNFTTATLEDNDSIIIYLPQQSGGGRPTWDELVPLITNPIETKTPEERLQKLIETDCSWDKIKGTNTDINAVTSNLASLPSNLDTYALSLSWSTNGSSYMSDSGKIISKPNLGGEPVEVTLTLSVKNGLMPNTYKYGDYPENTPVKTYELTILPYSQEEADAGKVSVKAALETITLDELKIIGGEALDPDNVSYDISLADPRQYGDKTTDYLSEGYWSSDKPDVISVNWLRGKVTRPAVGEADETVKLTVKASKGGYEESKEFTVTVKAVTQTEIDAVNDELDAVKNNLIFDVIKKENISSDAVTSSLQMVYRGLGYPGEITWATSNSGEKGIKIEWETSDPSTVASYGTVTRPAVADKDVILTATLTPFRLAEYIEPQTVEIPLVVRKVSESANVAEISLSPSLNFVFDGAIKSYDVTASPLSDKVKIDIKTEEAAALITSGEHSRRGTLSFEVIINSGGTKTVTIKTKALDSVKTDTYTINITRSVAAATDTEVLEVLNSIAESYKNTSNHWAAMDMSAFDRAGDVAGKTIVENARDIYNDGSVTDIQRSIITLTSLGVDASNVYSGSESIYLNFIDKLVIKTPSQIMEAIFGLLALDSGEYDDIGTFTRQSCINFLLNNKMEPAEGQYAWIIWGDAPDIDTTAMAVSALAPYYNDIDVKVAVDGALKYLSAEQSSLGHYGNSNSTSMVIVALTALGKDPSALEGDFAKNGNSLVDGLLAFKTSSNEFGWDDGAAVSNLSTEQGFRALVAYKKFVDLGNKQYNIYSFGPQTGDGTALTGESDSGITSPDPNAPKSITVRVENLYNGTTLMPETTVELSGTHLDALKAALVANERNPDTDLTVLSGYVSSVLGVSGGETTGWMYAVNGEIPITMLSETQVVEGDSLVMFYIDWYDTFYFTMFDKTTANIKEGVSITFKLTGINPWDVMGSSGAYAPIAGATVYAYDEGGNVTGMQSVTDLDGKATLTFTTAGTYTVSATREGAINATDLVPPLCTVKVTSSSPEPHDTITVYFTLKGLNDSNKEETWVNKKAVANIAKGATVSEVIIKALEGTGYTQKGAQDGYLESITTPNGFTLSEKHDGMMNSGWLYKVNSQLPTVGMDFYIVKNGDNILIYFTKDYTKDPDAGTVSGENKKTTAEPITDVITIDTEKRISFDDIDESMSWARDAIEILAGNGIIDGTGSGFEPHRFMTRAEFIKIIVKALNLETKRASGNVFNDVYESEWFADFVECASENKIISGDSDGKFRPNDVISRNEIAVVLKRIADSQEVLENYDLELQDAKDIPEWAESGVKYAVKANLMKGYEDNTFRGAQPITRAEAAAVIYRYLTLIV